MEIIKVDLNNKQILNLDNTIQVQQGDQQVTVCLVFTYGTDVVDMSDGKLGFISGSTAGGHNVEIENAGNSAGQCVLTLPGYFFQDAGTFEWLYIGIKGSNENPITAVPAQLNVLASQLDNNINTGNYRDDWQKFKDGLTGDVSQLTSEVDDVASQANSAGQKLSSATKAFSGLMSSANSEVKSACTYATSATDKAVSQAKSSVDDMNDGLKTAISGMSDNVANMVGQKTQAIQNNTDDLTNIKGILPTLVSPNLAVNSEFITTVAGHQPYDDWQPAVGWFYQNGGAISRKSWYGYSALQAASLSSDNYIVSAGVNAGYLNASTNIYSAAIKYNKSGTLAADKTITVSLEYAYDSQFTNSKKTVIGTITTNSTAGWTQLKAENISVPANMNWLRICIEDNKPKDDSYCWFAQPIINRGSTLLPYVASNIPAPYFTHQYLSDTSLMNGASGTIKVQQLGNVVLINLIATQAPSGQVIYQLPQQYRPISQQQAACVEANSNTLYNNFFAVNTDGTITVYQRKYDNSNIDKMNFNATFSYFTN